MKKAITISAGLFIAIILLAQAPEKISYQAVIRNSSDQLVTETQIGMQISILQGTAAGSPVYTETQTPTTNANGLVSIEIGTGTTSDVFSAIDWSDGPYFIKTETDPAGNTNYTITGVSQLLSVPYALHAKTAETVTGALSETDPVFTAWDKSTGVSVTESQISDLGTYLETETDPVFVAWDKSTGVAITESQITDLGNYLETETDPVFSAWDKSAGVSVTESQISDLGTYLETESDPVFVAWDKDYADLTNAPTTITTAQADAITANTVKVGYTDALVSANADVAANTAKVGITTAQADAIVANTAKVSAATGTQTGEMQYWNGSEWITVSAGNEGQVLTFVSGVPTWKTKVGDNFVINFTTGKVWMDRNLGASQVATSSTDADAYGDLYQWGRASDGHEIRTSSTTATLSSSDTPGHGDFITNGSSPYDWRNPQNDDLWQGVSGTNNPCPNGYRLPTEAEWEAERTSWGSNNSAGAFASPLKLPVAGRRLSSGGSLYLVDSFGFYWSSTLDGTLSRGLFFGSSTAGMGSYRRASGSSVRCLKD